ncbi:carboxypeptidase-like regulatory domain-containing protein [Robiginitalea sp. M366]|uniref:carboxypeptidase-like regulatory domain-containing protein n=1 Tax=Robiginitalea aestuariiviva TaxID=3036903 RepID=UPI00240D3075|nr:carboxypeptidase-like regulatory domain-containing protein [Robiginitalea aestuariiviva]MDG1571394.1 carboxypeptidase-like regulatory domain-containing protein [Robiginitalea aestuariiviva]
MAYRIHIPEPCSENWHHMTPTQKGAFCASCEKEVIDFTQTSLAELGRRLQGGQNLCGRFRPDQLDTPLPNPSRRRWREGVAALGFTSLMFTAAEVSAQETKVEVVQVAQEEPEEVETETVLGGIIRESLPMPETGTEIKGVVMDADGVPLPGARVSVVGTRLAAQTDFDGNFTIRLASVLAEKELLLVSSYLGFYPQQIRVKPGQGANITFQVEMTEDVLGGFAVYRSNIFRRIGNLFRRNRF